MTDPPSGLIRYQHHNDILHVKGFVVNVHDAVNFDIDLFLPSYNRYEEVISNTYMYSVLDPSISPYLQKEQPLYTSVAYRCRLRGVGVNFRRRSEDRGKRKTNSAMMDVIRLIDRSNGWVICNVSDVDVYRRILVDITVPVDGGVNLKSFLLTAYTGGIFFPYSKEEEPKGNVEAKATEEEVPAPTLSMPFKHALRSSHLVDNVLDPV
jgi:hypothetical protein